MKASPNTQIVSSEALRLVASTPGATGASRLLWALLVFLLLALLFVPWQQTAKGSGKVIAYAPLERQQTIEAPIDGRITQWWVQEGSAVKAGDPLVELSDNDPAFVERLRIEEETFKTRLAAAKARHQSLSERLKMLKSSRSLALSSAELRLDVANERVNAASEAQAAALLAYETAQTQKARIKELAAQGLAAERDLELAELDLESKRAEHSRAEAALRGAKSEALALKAERLKTGTDADANIESAIAELERATSEEASAIAELTRAEGRLARQGAQRITAPRDGVVLRLLTNQGGEMVKAGDPLLVFVPSSLSRAVEVWVDGNDAPLIQPGDTVRLQFEGWPALQFAGWPSVAVGTFGGVVSLVDVADDGAGRFRVLITPDPNDAPWPSNHYLRQGVRTNAWILLQEVSLGYEFWRQLNGFPPAIKSPPAEEKQKK
jgi:adhesin transport system membrane fusion protein